MTDYTYHNRDPLLETSGKVIGFFSREFFAFSNFSSFQVEWKGKLWQTSEHAYQASQFFETAPELVDKIFKVGSAYEALIIGVDNADKKQSNWDEIKVSIMEDIVRHKLNQNPYILRKLMETGDRLIVEDSPTDNFWGWGPKRDGRNELGKIWMKLRNEKKNIDIKK